MKKRLCNFLRFAYKNRQSFIAVWLVVLTVFQCGLFIGFIKASKEEVVPETTTEPQWEYFEASAYCKCRKCCGKYADNRPTDEYGEEIVYGAAGIPLEEGVSIAADWNVLPSGTVIEIENYGVYTVEDKGGDIVGNKIDIYFDSHVIAEAFGRKWVNIRILEKGGD